MDKGAVTNSRAPHQPKSVATLSCAEAPGTEGRFARAAGQCVRALVLDRSQQRVIIFVSGSIWSKPSGTHRELESSLADR